MDWNEFLNSADLLLKDLSLKGNRSYNENLDLKLDTYFFIFDCINPSILRASEDLEKVLGYSNDEFTIELFFNSIHPEDKDVFMLNEQKALNFCINLPIEKQKNFKIVHDYRLQKKNGEYIRILQQTAAFEVNDIAVLKTIIQHTDITTIKSDKTSQLHFIDLKGKESIYNITVNTEVNNIINIKLTKREKDILILLDKGFTSEQIAEKLFISVHTVRTHRKNLLAKTNCENTIELITITKNLISN